jgi:hypothetical protein
MRAERPDMLRSFNLKFDCVVSGEFSFHFFIGRRLICSILKIYFSERQINFFEAISDPINVDWE